MVSASALINTILTQMQEYVKEGALKAFRGTKILQQLVKNRIECMK